MSLFNGLSSIFFELEPQHLRLCKLETLRQNSHLIVPDRRVMRRNGKTVPNGYARWTGFGTHSIVVATRYLHRTGIKMF